MVRNVVRWGCAAFLLVPLLASAQGRADTLEQAVQDALASQPEVQDKWHEFLAAQDERARVSGQYLPSLDLNGSAGRRERDYDARGQYTQGRVEISLTQMLFEGFRVRRQLQRADHTVLERYYELLDVAEQIASDTAGAYLDVQRYRALVKLAEANVENHHFVFDQIELRAQRGVGNKADLAQVAGRLALAQANLLTEHANLRDVSTRFQRLTGRAALREMEAAPAAFVADESDLQRVLLQSYAGNPGLFARFEAIDGARAKLGESRSELYPKLEFGVRHGIYQNDNGFLEQVGGPVSGEETVVELRMRYNLFRGGQDRATMRADAHRIQRREDLRDKACIDLRQTTTISHNDVVNLSARLKQLAVHRDSAKQVVQAYRKQFDIGRRSLLDVLDAENETFQAQRAYMHATYDQAIARYRILRDQGSVMRSLDLVPQDFPSLVELGGRPQGASARNYCQQFAAMALDGAALTGVPTRQYSEMVVLESSALFESSSAQLQRKASKVLQEFVQTLKEMGDVRELTITGHADSSGDTDFNRVLSVSRAEAVKQYLLNAGLADIAITAVGKGDAQPLESNETPEGRAANRRVEIRILRRR